MNDERIGEEYQEAESARSSSEQVNVNNNDKGNESRMETAATTTITSNRASTKETIHPELHDSYILTQSSEREQQQLQQLHETSVNQSSDGICMCPLNALNGCTWYGRHSELREHLETVCFQRHFPISDRRTIGEQNIIIQIRDFIHNGMCQYLTKQKILSQCSQQLQVPLSICKQVWKLLEVFNAPFFQAYEQRLLVRIQMEMFNSIVNEMESTLADHESVTMPQLGGSHLSTSSLLTQQEYAQNWLSSPQILHQQTIPQNHSYELPNYDISSNERYVTEQFSDAGLFPYGQRYSELSTGSASDSIAMQHFNIGQTYSQQQQQQQQNNTYLFINNDPTSTSRENQSRSQQDGTKDLQFIFHHEDGDK